MHFQWFHCICLGRFRNSLYTAKELDRCQSNIQYDTLSTFRFISLLRRFADTQQCLQQLMILNNVNLNQWQYVATTMAAVTSCGYYDGNYLGSIRPECSSKPFRTFEIESRWSKSLFLQKFWTKNKNVQHFYPFFYESDFNEPNFFSQKQIGKK